ncbi:MAG: hypothetical protein KIS92_23705 [Planctomycetota bacterium]|nr:hypothetical protein [Planctomycetota bacterium]
MPKSLANRVTLVVVGALVLAFGTAGVAIYGRVKRSLELKAEKALEIRLTWVAAALDYDNGFLHLEARPEPNDGAEGWRVATVSGKELWASAHAPEPNERMVKSRRIAVGPAARGRGDAPEPVAWRDTEGRGANRMAGAEYFLPEGTGLDLAIEASFSSTEMQAELARLGWALGTVGPVSVLLLSGLCAWLIRWQLRPLAEIAERAAKIGPESADARLGPARGESAECAQLREALDRMIARLAEGLAREKQFVGDASHELRTPLAQMRTQIEVALRKERPAGEYRRALEDALLDIRRLQDLIAGFLGLARGTPAGAPAERVALADLLREAGHGTPLEPGGGVGGAAVLGSAPLLVSAFQNVFENARKYAPGIPPRLRLEEDDATVRIAVLDEGPGVPEAERERIFQPLVRLDAARREGGFGLGLAIARKAVRACGGDLVCRARRDGARGAEFVFLLRKAAVPA